MRLKSVPRRQESIRYDRNGPSLAFVVSHSVHQHAMSSSCDVTCLVWIPMLITESVRGEIGGLGLVLRTGQPATSIKLTGNRVRPGTFTAVSRASHDSRIFHTLETFTTLTEFHKKTSTATNGWYTKSQSARLKLDLSTRLPPSTTFYDGRVDDRTTTTEIQHKNPEWKPLFRFSRGFWKKI